LSEVANLLKAARGYADDGVEPMRAVMLAQADALERGTKVADVAKLFMVWAVERAACDDISTSIDIALAAAERAETRTRGTPDPLARDLIAFVDGYLKGTVSDEEFIARLREPHM
jgi:hypothetical protein